MRGGRENISRGRARKTPPPQADRGEGGNIPRRARYISRRGENTRKADTLRPAKAKRMAKRKNILSRRREEARRSYRLAKSADHAISIFRSLEIREMPRASRLDDLTIPNEPPQSLAHIKRRLFILASPEKKGGRKDFLRVGHARRIHDIYERLSHRATQGDIIRAPRPFRRMAEGFPDLIKSTRRAYFTPRRGGMPALSTRTRARTKLSSAARRIATRPPKECPMRIASSTPRSERRSLTPRA